SAAAGSGKGGRSRPAAAPTARSTGTRRRAWPRPAARGGRNRRRERRRRYALSWPGPRGWPWCPAGSVPFARWDGHDVVPSRELEQAGKDGDTEQVVDDALALGDVEPRVGHKALHRIDEDGIQNERPADDLNRKGEVARPRGEPGERNEQSHQQDYEPIPGASEAVHRGRRPWYHFSGQASYFGQFL